jgi:glutaredoxin
VSVVVLYGRPGCCLCEDARELLERLRSEHRFELIERDIESDERLLRAYLERIPVLEIDGVERFELTVDEQRLRAALAGAAAPRAQPQPAREGRHPQIPTDQINHLESAP